MYIQMHFGNSFVVYKQLQGGPLPVTSGVISPLRRVIIVITPPSYFRPLKKGPKNPPALRTIGSGASKLLRVFFAEPLNEQRSFRVFL